MKPLEAIKHWPVGETTDPRNYQYLFPFMVADGVKELELTREEYAAFFKAYSQELANLNVASGGVVFAGVKIKKC